MAKHTSNRKGEHNEVHCPPGLSVRERAMSDVYASDTDSLSLSDIQVTGHFTSWKRPAEALKA